MKNVEGRKVYEVTTTIMVIAETEQEARQKFISDLQDIDGDGCLKLEVKETNKRY